MYRLYCTLHCTELSSIVYILIMLASASLTELVISQPQMDMKVTSYTHSQVIHYVNEEIRAIVHLQSLPPKNYLKQCLTA